MDARPHIASYEVVWKFERRMAQWAGSRFAVATDSCTSAIFLCCKRLGVKEVTLPARTYISVPMAVIHAGGTVRFEDVEWSGSYQLKPYPIFDSALRMKRGMYLAGFHCLSFQMKKLLPIGKGGMILLDNEADAEWFRRARSNGRDARIPLGQDKIRSLGWNFSMTPEQGARGLQLLESLRDQDDLKAEYPDLRNMPVFQ